MSSTPKREKRTREFDFAERMSDHEALMWNIEKDPWLNPNGSALTILDRPIDMERFRRQVRHGVSVLPRLYQRVVPGFGRISTPAWVPDPEFDFDHHLRRIELAGAGTERDLFDLAARLATEPMDRTRPLWRFVVIDGLEGGRGALWSIFHHAISDGIGQIRMAELYQQLSRDEAEHPEVDLEAIVAAAVEAHRAKESGGDLATGLLETAGRSLGHLARRQAGLSRRALGEMMLWPADPSRVVRTAEDTAEVARSTVDQVMGGSSESSPPSPLWSTRSRHRHLEYVRVPLDGLKAAAKANGGSVNDAFMAGLTDAAARYHVGSSTPIDTVNTSFVLSTRKDNKVGGNSFTPVSITVPTAARTPGDRVRAIHSITESARESASGGASIGSLAGVANLLPTSVLARAARDRAAKIDFATSNLRGAPFPLYCAGAKVEASVCLGPVAGTAANVTALSYDGHFDMGIFLDPSAIEDPARYRDCVVAAFDDLIGSVAAPEEKAPAKKTKKKATAKKTKKKAASQKAGASKKATKKTSATADTVTDTAAGTLETKATDTSTEAE